MRLPSLTLVVILLASTAFPQTLRNVTMQVVFVTFIENRDHSWADPATRGPQYITQIHTFWHSNDASFGAITVTGSTYGWADLNLSTANVGPGCSAIPPATAAIVGPIPAGVIRLIVPPAGLPCNAEAIGNVILSASYLEHEFGHTLGLAHNFEQHCQTMTSDRCDVQEYGHYSVMGTFTGVSPYERERLGVFSPTYAMPTVTTTQTVTVQLSNTGTPGIKSVKVPATVLVQLCGGVPVTCFTTTEDHTLYAEYRDGDVAAKGVLLWTNRERLDTLIDVDRMTSATQFHLALGATYCDPLNLWCVTVTAQDALTATLSLQVSGVAPPPVHTAPAALLWTPVAAPVHTAPTNLSWSPQ